VYSYTEGTADLRKVRLDSASTNLERTPVMVEGKVERIKDIGSMITQWEALDGGVDGGGGGAEGR
jgi:hypothetical protein